MKLKNRVKKSLNSYVKHHDDLKQARISSNRRNGRKTLKIKIKEIE